MDYNIGDVLRLREGFDFYRDGTGAFTVESDVLVTVTGRPGTDNYGVYFEYLAGGTKNDAITLRPSGSAEGTGGYIAGQPWQRTPVLQERTIRILTADTAPSTDDLLLKFGEIADANTCKEQRVVIDKALKDLAAALAPF